MDYKEAIAARRSSYMLDDDIVAAGVTMEEIIDNINKIAPHVPSSWNSQSMKLMILTGDDHRYFWSIVEDVLRKKVNDEERFKKTSVKLNGFAKAAGTILFYEDEETTNRLIEDNPKYAETMSLWAEHGNAMMQFAIWVAMYDMGLGANIQHYNPIIDDKVKDTFDIPENHRLVAQLVFGRITDENPRVEKKPAESIVIIGHARK